MVPGEPEIVGWTRQLADNLKRLRDERGWSARQLALRAGVHVDTVLALEHEDQDPRMGTVLRLQGAFELCSIEELLGAPPAMPSRRHADAILDQRASTSGAA